MPREEGATLAPEWTGRHNSPKVHERIRAAIESGASSEQIGTMINDTLTEAAEQRLLNDIGRTELSVRSEQSEDPETRALLNRIDNLAVSALDRARQAKNEAGKILPISDNRELERKVKMFEDDLGKNQASVLEQLDWEAQSARSTMSAEERAAFDRAVNEFTTPALPGENPNELFAVPPLTELTPQEEQNLFTMPDFNTGSVRQDSTPDIRGMNKAELDAALKEVPTKRTTPLKVPAYMKKADHAWGARQSPVESEEKTFDVPGFTPSEKPPIQQTRFQKWRDKLYRIASKI